MLLSWKLAPALAAGNTVVVKPSEFTSSSTLEFVKLIEEAGFPAGRRQHRHRLRRRGRPARSSSTRGSPRSPSPAATRPARAIYAQAARGLKHVTLELGGKSPNIIFDDANLEDAVKGAISGIFAASGQTCIAGSRLLVQRTIHDEVCASVVALAATARLGDPMDAGTQVGPITTTAQREKVLGYIDVARPKARGCCSAADAATRPSWRGLVRRSRRSSPTSPTPCASRARRSSARSSRSSLSRTRTRRSRSPTTPSTASPPASGPPTSAAPSHGRPLRAGTVWVNTYRAVSYMAPFGGYKMSGIGRESGLAAIDEYLQTKSVWINLAEGVPNPFVIR